MRAQTAEIPAREKILDAAEALFARRGFTGVGISEIAEAVGLSKSTLFHHYATKAQLYAAVVERILAEIETALMRALAAGGTPVERLDRWVDTVCDLLGAQPTYARLLLRSLFEDDELSHDSENVRAADQRLARIVASMHTLLREGMAGGGLRMANLPHTIHSLIGLVIYHFASGDFGVEVLGRSPFAAAEVRRRKDEIKAFLHHGLVAPTAPPKGDRA
jgi:AcrR family transcriptional regulator